MRPKLPSGTVTFLLTDVEGSTRLLHELGAEGYAEALAEHRRIVREACAAHDGVEVDTQGDAFFVAFPTAPGALAAARAITERLAESLIRLRMGLHTGTPLVTNEGYVGDDVHRAARVAASGHGGQVLVSSSTAALLDGRALRDLGEHRFKDLAAPERVYQLGDDAFPALKSLYRTNLPVPATTFLGRERELLEVVELLEREDVRLLTLTGPGGTGKTRLALQAAAEAAERFPHGITWIALASLRDPAHLLPAVAQALDLTEEPGQTIAETLATALAGKQALLVLDNVEHLLPDAAGGLSALGATPGPVLLVTSRERVQLQGEHLYPVPTLDESDAVALFLARARALDPGFRANGAVAELCSRLDHLPLALELAAARTVVFTPKQLVERLAERLDLLKGGRDADPRQQTLRAMIAWSYDLLATEEQRLFRSLSVFAGGCTYEASEEICGADPDTLQSLLDKNLLRRRDSALGPRYWMLETIREFAAEQLDASAEAADLAARHSRHFVELAERAEPELTGSEQARWLSCLEADLDNLRGALEYASRTEEPTTLLRLSNALFRFWSVRGYLVEGASWLDAALDAAPVQSTARADALSAAAAMSYRRGRYTEARRLADEAIATSRALGYRRGTGRALVRLADAVEAEGELDRAWRLFDEARSIAREIGDHFGLAIATGNLGDLALMRRDYAQAESLCGESLELMRELGHEEGVAVQLLNVGLASMQQGRYAEAVPLFRESLSLLRRLNSPFHLAHVLDSLAAVAAQGAGGEIAARLLGAVDAMLGEIGGSLDPSQGELHANAVAATRARLGDLAFEKAAAEGRRMTLDEVVDYAREAAYA